VRAKVLTRARETSFINCWTRNTAQAVNYGQQLQEKVNFRKTTVVVSTYLPNGWYLERSCSDYKSTIPSRTYDLHRFYPLRCAQNGVKVRHRQWIGLSIRPVTSVLENWVILLPLRGIGQQLQAFKQLQGNPKMAWQVCNDRCWSIWNLGSRTLARVLYGRVS